MRARRLGVGRGGGRYEPRSAAGDAAFGAVTRGVASLDALEELSGRS
ncbi:hypothetical protein ACFV2B_09330 [Streptomyces lavendulae]